MANVFLKKPKNRLFLQFTGHFFSNNYRVLKAGLGIVELSTFCVEGNSARISKDVWVAWQFIYTALSGYEILEHCKTIGGIDGLKFFQKMM